MEDIPKDIFQENLSAYILQHKDGYHKVGRLTAFIATFRNTEITAIDMLNLIEQGLNIVRFKLSHTTMADKVYLFNAIKEAEEKYCEKYGETHRAITVIIDIPNCLIKTGVFKDDEVNIHIKVDSIVKLTCEDYYSDKCDKNTIFIDDAYAIKAFKVGLEINFGYGEVVMYCIEIINENNVLCKVRKGGEIVCMDSVCVRGVVHTKPPLTKRDLNLIEFAKEYDVPVLIVHSVRYASTLRMLKKLTKNHEISVLATICEKQGLDNIDEIIQESNGIILAREYLTHELINPNRLAMIQMNVCAKCHQQGKPIYLSGHIMGHYLTDGSESILDISDVTNAIIQGAGLVLRDYKEYSYLLKTIGELDKICKLIEPLCKRINDFWRNHLEFPIPVNAAEACIVSCGLSALRYGAKLIVVPSVSGVTVRKLVRVAPTILIVPVTKRLTIAKRLRLFNCVVPVVYSQKKLCDHNEEVNARVDFVVEYCLKHGMNSPGENYVILQRSVETSPYCDMIRFGITK